MEVLSRPDQIGEVAAALLCAVSSSSSDGSVNATQSALIPVMGIPFIEFQIGQLAKNGIKHVYLEIETLPGALVAMADRVKAKGITVEFVRSPAELAGKIHPDQYLFVLSDGVYVDDILLSEMIAQNNAFIVTLDGRDENSIFERIDLNSYWTGIAMLGASSVEGIASLPSEWSINSSLLRRALQDSIVHRSLKQDVIAAKKLCKIGSTTDAETLTKQLLGSQSSKVDGLIERSIFAPLISWVMPVIWKLPSNALSFRIFAWLSLSIVLGLAISGFSLGAALISLISLLAFQACKLLQVTNNKRDFGLSHANIMWSLLIAAFIAVFWNQSTDRIESMFCGLVIIGLAVLSSQIARSNWSRNLLCSPALLAMLMLVFVGLGWVLHGFMLVGLFQLGALIFIRRNEVSLH
jgi:hypothetical protein